MSAAVVVLGTMFRGDDGIGPLVGERLRADGVEVIDCGDEPTRLIDPCAGLDLLIVVDAVRTGAPPGTLHEIEADAEGLPRDLSYASSHAVGIADALELARALGRAPRRVVLVGVEGAAFGMGDPLTHEVVAAAPEAVKRVHTTLKESRCTKRP